jgi:ribosomal protein S18 acetylase RimI-like enzyme
MRADLAEVEQPGAVPHGFELVMYHPSMSQRLLDAHNTAFLDHPHFTPWTEGMWRQWVTGSRNFRPDLSFLLLDRRASAAGDTGGVIASYLQTNEYDATLAATGRREAFVAKVGSLRGYRGRGLASFLLRHSLAAYRAAGYDEAALDVDSENPTGALGIYQRAGFAVERRWADYVRNVPARGPGLT